MIHNKAINIVMSPLCFQRVSLVRCQCGLISLPLPSFLHMLQQLLSILVRLQTQLNFQEFLIHVEQGRTGGKGIIGWDH
jgi:hypothetical protein